MDICVKGSKKRSMKQILHWKNFLALILLIPFLYNGSANASHSMGADMTYECLGGNTYRITLSFYRDCIGSPAPGNPYITINSSSCSQSLGVTLSRVPGTGQEVTPICASASSTCDGGTFTGIEEWIYQGIVTLPAQCSDWVFGYSLCCRNAAITTINSPNSNTFYISSTLNNLVVPCNSSPTFSNMPVPFLCRGQQFCFNHGAYDVDGDSLVYQLIPPRQSVTSNVTYVAPYSATNPLNSVPATSFNTATGDICLTPQSIEVTVTAVLVKEYRNGVLIGSVERDLQLTVMNCTNNLPSLTGIDGTNNFTTTTCAGQPVCFDIFSNDADNGQQLSVTWNSSIPGATFTTTNTAQPTATFCWTPGPGNAGNSYDFTATVTDDACPYFGSQTYAYTINVGGLSVNAGPNQAIACTSLATLTATPSGAMGPVSYLWSTGATTATISAGAGTYWVTADDGGCIASDTVVVTTPNIPLAAFVSPLNACVNMPVSFTNQSTTPSGSITSYSWTFGDGGTSTSVSPTYTYAATGTYPVRLIIVNSSGCSDTVTHNITINSATNSAFTWVPACVNMNIAFTDQSTGSPVSWNWNFGDGGTSVQQNPGHIYTSAGTYQVRLVTTASSGCTDTVIQAVQVANAPVANAGSDRYMCLGNSMTLTASGGQNYSWSPGGQTTASITVSPTVTTTYTVVVTNASGCSSSDNVTVSINPLPNVSAGPDRILCSGNSVALTASGANLYTWSPGGQTTPTINVSPTATTSYTVTGTNANGCSNTDVVQVTVNSSPVVNAGNDQAVCAGTSVNLTASGATTYQWQPGGSSNQSLTVTPSSTTTYTVTGSNAAGCTSTDAVTVTVNPIPIVNLSQVFFCDGSSAILDAGNPGSTYAWSTGETTRTITVTDSGNYSVVVTSGAGCQSNSTALITVGYISNTATQNYQICAGQTAVLNANHPGCTYLWSNGSTNQSISVNTTGTYTVQLTDANGCTATMSHIVKVNPLPVPAFTATAACFGEPVTLNDNSTVSGGNIQSVAWQMGDGSVASTPAVSHTYSNAGSYNVTLTATSVNGCTASIIQPVIVNPLPASNIIAPPACQNSSVQFNSNASVPGGTIASYAWNFGDGTTSNQQSPSHAYTSAGTKNVTLIVTSNNGCKDTAFTTVNIHNLPTPSFAAVNGCQGTLINFTNNSSGNGSQLTSQRWNFGDGDTSVNQNPSHTYTTSGVFNVTLTTSNANGCVSSITQPVTVHPVPDANFNAAAVCDGIPVNFNNVSTVPTGIIQSYSWNFGDNNTSSAVSPIHTYLTTGVYQVSMIATTSFGCIDSVTKTFTVNPTPVPSFTTTDICEGATSYFQDNSSVNSGSISSRHWDFSDGNSSTLISPYHQYANPGSYTVTLTVTSNWGCTATYSTPANVNPNPVASFASTDICEGSSAQFLNLSMISNGDSLTHTWSFGDGNYSTDDNPFHSYGLAGNYLAQLSVTSTHSCTAQYFDTVNVYHKPQAMFAAPNACASDPITFVNQSSSTDGNIIATLWTFGDGTSSSENAPQHHYSDTGQFNVQLMTITSLGCMDTYSDTVEVFSHPTVHIQINNSCEGIPVTMRANSNMGGNMNYQWSIGNNVVSNASAYNHIFNQPGTYNVSLLATSSEGCEGTANNQVTVYARPAVAFSSSEVCQGVQTQFHNQSTVINGVITTYTWNFGDSNFSGQSNPSHTYVNAGVYNASLTAITNYGCSNSGNHQVRVNPKPMVAFAAGTQGCSPVNAGFTETVSISSGTISGYLWDFGDGNISNDARPYHMYTQPGSYDVTLNVVSDKGCTASHTTQNVVVVHPQPTAEFTADPMVVDIEMPVVTFHNESQGYQTYQWFFGDGSGSFDMNPTHAFNDTGTYAAMLVTVNNYGCRDTTYRYIEVKLRSTLFVANTFTPNGDGNNDQFQPYHTNMEDITVSIFNRWGTMLTSWDGLGGSWDGFYNGKKCQPDVYVYKISGKGVDGKSAELVGHVTIIY